jgi:hypothetical protein
MDEKIRKIKGLAKREVKELSQLEKMDRKRDKVCELGEKMKKKGKK